VLYAGTGEKVGSVPGAGLQGNGVFKTTNGGDSWLPLISTRNKLDFYFVNRLAISPTNNQILLAATETAIFRSTDGGETWSRRPVCLNRRPSKVQPCLPSTTSCCFKDVRFHPSDGTKCIAGDARGNAYYSIDGGVTWATANGFPTAVRRVELAY